MFHRGLGRPTKRCTLGIYDILHLSIPSLIQNEQASFMNYHEHIWYPETWNLQHVTVDMNANMLAHVQDDLHVHVYVHVNLWKSS